MATTSGDQCHGAAASDGRACTAPAELAGGAVLDPETSRFYCRAMAVLNAAGVPFLVGGAYAFERYTGIARHTKDLDVFVRREDSERALAAFEADGCEVETTFPHWLGKAFCGENFVDLIFGSGNGVAPVDESWFERAAEAEVLGSKVKLVPVEEMIWQKAFIMERERFDGADVAHLLRANAERIDWPRLVRRFGDHWRVLLSHLVMFGFIYPAERDAIPRWAMHELTRRLAADVTNSPPDGRVCQGTLISRAQYLVDVHRWGYDDARLGPDGTMEPRDVQLWTDAIATGR
jgi:hypothetical protein